MRPISDIERDANAATPGPWVHRRDAYGSESEPSIVGGDRPVPVFTSGPFMRMEDGDFVANARADIPDLLETVKRLRSLLVEARYELDQEMPDLNEHNPSDIRHRIDAALREVPVDSAAVLP